MNAIEPKVREFCAAFARSARRHAAASTSSRDLGAQMPMRTIGMLLGIPEQDQEAIRDKLDAGLRLEEGKPDAVAATALAAYSEMFADYVDWRAEHPSDDLMTELLTAEFEDETGTTRRLTRDRGPHLRQPARGRGQRDDHAAHRLDGQGARRAPRPAARDRRRPVARAEGDRGAAALRGAVAGPGALRRPRRRALRRDGARGQRHGAAQRIGEPRRAAVPRRRSLRHPPRVAART